MSHSEKVMERKIVMLERRMGMVEQFVEQRFCDTFRDFTVRYNYQESSRKLSNRRDRRSSTDDDSDADSYGYSNGSRRSRKRARRRSSIGIQVTRSSEAKDPGGNGSTSNQRNHSDTIEAQVSRFFAPNDHGHSSTSNPRIRFDNIEVPPVFRPSEIKRIEQPSDNQRNSANIGVRTNSQSNDQKEQSTYDHISTPDNTQNSSEPKIPHSNEQHSTPTTSITSQPTPSDSVVDIVKPSQPKNSVKYESTNDQRSDTSSQIQACAPATSAAVVEALENSLNPPDQNQNPKSPAASLPPENILEPNVNADARNSVPSDPTYQEVMNEYTHNQMPNNNSFTYGNTTMEYETNEMDIPPVNVHMFEMPDSSENEEVDENAESRNDSNEMSNCKSTEKGEEISIPADMIIPEGADVVTVTTVCTDSVLAPPCNMQISHENVQSPHGPLSNEIQTLMVSKPNENVSKTHQYTTSGPEIIDSHQQSGENVNLTKNIPRTAVVNLYTDADQTTTINNVISNLAVPPPISSTFIISPSTGIPTTSFPFNPLAPQIQNIRAPVPEFAKEIGRKTFVIPVVTEAPTQTELAKNSVSISTTLTKPQNTFGTKLDTVVLPPVSIPSSSFVPIQPLPAVIPNNEFPLKQTQSDKTMTPIVFTTPQAKTVLCDNYQVPIADKRISTGESRPGQESSQRVVELPRVPTLSLVSVVNEERKEIVPCTTFNYNLTTHANINKDCSGFNNNSGISLAQFVKSATFSETVHHTTTFQCDTDKLGMVHGVILPGSVQYGNKEPETVELSSESDDESKRTMMNYSALNVTEHAEVSPDSGISEVSRNAGSAETLPNPDVDITIEMEGDVVSVINHKNVTSNNETDNQITDPRPVSSRRTSDAENLTTDESSSEEEDDDDKSSSDDDDDDDDNGDEENTYSESHAQVNLPQAADTGLPGLNTESFPRTVILSAPVLPKMESVQESITRMQPPRAIMEGSLQPPRSNTPSDKTNANKQSPSVPVSQPPNSAQPSSDDTGNVITLSSDEEEEKTSEPTPSNLNIQTRFPPRRFSRPPQPHVQQQLAAAFLFTKQTTVGETQSVHLITSKQASVASTYNQRTNRNRFLLSTSSTSCVSLVQNQHENILASNPGIHFRNRFTSLPPRRPMITASRVSTEHSQDKNESFDDCLIPEVVLDVDSEEERRTGQKQIITQLQHMNRSKLASMSGVNEVSTTNKDEDDKFEESGPDQGMNAVARQLRMMKQDPNLPANESNLAQRSIPGRSSSVSTTASVSSTRDAENSADGFPPSLVPIIDLESETPDGGATTENSVSELARDENTYSEEPSMPILCASGLRENEELKSLKSDETPEETEMNSTSAQNMDDTESVETIEILPDSTPAEQDKDGDFVTPFTSAVSTTYSSPHPNSGGNEDDSSPYSYQYPYDPNTPLSELTFDRKCRRPIVYCLECQASFTSRDILEEHRRTMHSGESEGDSEFVVPNENDNDTTEGSLSPVTRRSKRQKKMSIKMKNSLMTNAMCWKSGKDEINDQTKKCRRKDSNTDKKRENDLSKDSLTGFQEISQKICANTGYRSVVCPYCGKRVAYMQRLKHIREKDCKITPEQLEREEQQKGDNSLSAWVDATKSVKQRSEVFAKKSTPDKGKVGKGEVCDVTDLNDDVSTQEMDSEEDDFDEYDSQSDKESIVSSKSRKSNVSTRSSKYRKVRTPSGASKVDTSGDEGQVPSSSKRQKSDICPPEQNQIQICSGQMPPEVGATNAIVVSEVIIPGTSHALISPSLNQHLYDFEEFQTLGGAMVVHPDLHGVGIFDESGNFERDRGMFIYADGFNNSVDTEEITCNDESSLTNFVDKSSHQAISEANVLQSLCPPVSTVVSMPQPATQFIAAAGTFHDTGGTTATVSNEGQGSSSLVESSTNNFDVDKPSDFDWKDNDKTTSANCPNCGKSMRKSSIKRHLKEVCLKGKNKRDLLKLHFRQGPIPLIPTANDLLCKYEDCGYIANNLKEFKEHLTIHPLHLALPCVTCGKIFIEELNLQDHMTNSHQAKPAQDNEIVANSTVTFQLEPKVVENATDYPHDGA